MDTIRNVLVQLGDPATWETLDSGLVATSDGAGELLTTSIGNVQRCALTRPLSGSWVARVDVVTAAVITTALCIGVLPVASRETLAERRPTGAARPQDWNLTAVGRSAIVVDRAGGIWRDGAGVGGVTAPAAGSSIYLIYDAAARTMTFRVNNHTAGGYTVAAVDGPLRIAANVAAATTSLRLVHDLERLPRIIGFRPAGVWGRLATAGVTDSATGAVWDGRIAADGDPTFEEVAAFEVMGGGRGRTRAVGDVVAINTPDMPGEQRKALDDWLGWHTRDEPITILRGNYGEALSTYTQVARGVIDGVIEPREGRIAISCRDPSARLDVPWQAETYPDTTPLASLRGRSKPTATGPCRAVPLVLTDASNLLYDAGDDASNASGSLGTVYDQGVVLTSGVGYSVDPNGKAIKRLTNPVGLQCATVNIGRLDVEVAIGATVGDFVQWSGSPAAPRGWTNPSTGTGTSVTSTANGARFVRGSTGQADLLTPNTQFPAANGIYHIDIDIAAHVSGALTIIFETSDGTATSVATINTTGVTGVRSIWVLKPANHVRMRLRVSGAAGDITVRSIRSALKSNVTNIAQHVRHAACYRGPLPESALDTSVDSYPAPLNAAGLCLATGPNDRRTVIQVLDALLASVGGAWWFGPDGKLCMTSLRDPASLMPVAVLDDTNVVGTIDVQPDRAPGLSTRIAADPTWAVHGESDIAGILRTTPAGLELADLLRNEYGAVATGGLVAPDYAHANANAPSGTLLTSAASAAQLAALRTALYRVPRLIYNVTADLSGVVSLRPGDGVALTRDGSTRNLLVIGKRGRYISDTIQLTLWG